MYAKIQSLKRQGFNRSDIADMLKLTRKTVSKYFKMNEAEFKRYHFDMIQRDKILDDYKIDILDVYRINEYKPLNMASVFDYMEEKYGEIPCTERTLRNYINTLIDLGELELKESVRMYNKVPQLPYGKQMQLDFGQYKTKSGLMVYIFAAVLSASRYKYIAFQTTPFTTLDVIHLLLDCFDFFQGVPVELVIDQDKLLVVSENQGDIIYTKKFQYFIDEIQLKMYVCRKADPESKGKIEHVIKYVKHNFFGTRDFSEIDEAKKGLASWLKRRANGKLSQATGRIPHDLITEERKSLRPLANSIFRKDYIACRDDRSVSEHSFISVNASLYSVPNKYRNRTVAIYTTTDMLFVFDPIQNHEIARHTLSSIPGKKIKNHEHFRQKESTASTLKQQVLDMFAMPGWKKFAEKNAKTFSRYIRDQCLDAQRFFTSETDAQVLEKAIEYCLANKTYSYANLRDTYQYFQVQSNQPEQGDASANPLFIEKKHLDVKKRDIQVYQSLLN
jgi:hypothetical protein